MRGEEREGTNMLVMFFIHLMNDLTVINKYMTTFQVQFHDHL